MKKSPPTEAPNNQTAEPQEAQDAPLYNEEILQYGFAHGKGKRLAKCDVSTRDVGALCGSRIIMDVVWDKQSPHARVGARVGEIGYHVDACALGTAAAAICAGAAIGADESELLEIHKQMKKMLKGEAFSFKSKSHWEKLSLLQAARHYPSRHAAILLPLNALLKAFRDKKS